MIKIIMTYDMSYEWIIGISLMFGLALVLNHYTFEDMKGFFVFLTLFNAFVVWGDLLPYWTLILNIIILTFVMYFEVNSKRSD